MIEGQQVSVRAPSHEHAALFALRAMGLDYATVSVTDSRGITLPVTVEDGRIL